MGSERGSKCRRLTVPTGDRKSSQRSRGLATRDLQRDSATYLHLTQAQKVLENARVCDVHTLSLKFVILNSSSLLGLSHKNRCQNHQANGFELGGA